MIRTIVRLVVLFALLSSVALVPSLTFAQSSTSDAVATEDEQPAMVDDVAPPATEPTEIPAAAPDVVVAPAPVVLEPAAPAVVIAPTPLAPAAPFVTATVVSTKRAPTPVRLFPDPSSAWPVSGPTNASVKAINGIPSPVDAPLFVNMFHPGGALFELRLANADEATYAYACPTGQCTGSAEAVWRAMPDQQREQYLGQLVTTARDNEAPGARTVRVRVIGSHGSGPMLGCGQLTPDSPNISFSSTAC